MTIINISIKAVKGDIILPDKSVRKPAMKRINILRRFDITIEASRLIEFFLSTIFNKKYPGRKLVNSIENINLAQFCKGIKFHSKTDKFIG